MASPEAAGSPLRSVAHSDELAPNCENILDPGCSSLVGLARRAGSTMDCRPSTELDGWSFSRSDLEEALRGERLLNPSLDSSNRFNLNGPVCFIEEKGSTRKTRRPDELSLTETLGVIDDFARAGARTINLLGAGEPTIDPHFRQVLLYVHKRNMRVVLFTNGIALSCDPDMVSLLREHATTVVVKYNSANPLMQDKLVAKKGYSRFRDRTLQILMKEGFAEQFPTRLGIDVLALDAVVDEIVEIYLAARRLNIVPLVADYIPTGRTEGGKFRGQEALRTVGQAVGLEDLFKPLTDEQRLRIHRDLVNLDREHFDLDIPTGPCSYYGAGRCTQVLGVYVDMMGRIWPCVARSQISAAQILTRPLGNLRAGDRPSTVWQTHPYMRGIRETFDGGCPYKTPLSIGDK